MGIHQTVSVATEQTARLKANVEKEAHGGWKKLVIDEDREHRGFTLNLPSGLILRRVSNSNCQNDITEVQNKTDLFAQDLIDL